MDSNMLQEKTWLEFVSKELNAKIELMEKDIFRDAERIQNFHKYMWENKGSMDVQEINSVRANSEQEANLYLQEREYFKKLVKIQSSPYFASIELWNDQQEKQRYYIGMTYLNQENLDHLIYDWRAPICSVFYDYEIGPCSYETPEGIKENHLFSKRQYKIENQELLRIIDSSIQIDDEVLQEVLANEAGEKMKNIVTTIQQEQNQVIRNTKDRHLVVQGIAGSGKTSVALHRIAFLLYKIKNLTSDKILIFSPNQIFTEYISNVLPELGESNTLQTTFHDYLKTQIKEYCGVESYPEFLRRYYNQTEKHFEVTKYKQSNEIIKDLEHFVADFVNRLTFKKKIIENHIYEYSVEELNDLFHEKYQNFPLFERIDQMAQKMSEQNYRGSSKKKSTYRKLLLESLSLKKDYRKLYLEFLNSPFFHQDTPLDHSYLKNKKRIIHYEDALLFVYLKGLMEGFFYDKYTEQVVIDEAQDYSILQYIILKKVFSKASFTILGDVHQTINPYYQYDSLNELSKLWTVRYIELNKTYRSSKEIIAYANNILDLRHVCAIQKGQDIPVIRRKAFNNLLHDIDYLKGKHKSVAIITHDDETAQRLYEQLASCYNISFITIDSKNFQKEFVLIPAYLAKGLEFESVLIYQDEHSFYKENEKNLFYVAVTRAQHELIVYE